MKIMVFLQGTIIMHSTGVGVSRVERVKQSKQAEPAVLDYATYAPIGNAVEKLKEWESKGTEIVYLSSNDNQNYVDLDQQILEKYNFPTGEVFWRQNNQSYVQIVEEVMPDVLIEDDCESIGGEKEMIYPHINIELKAKIKSVVVKEFEGIDNLPDNYLKLNDELL